MHLLNKIKMRIKIKIINKKNLKKNIYIYIFLKKRNCKFLLG